MPGRNRLAVEFSSLIYSRKQKRAGCRLTWVARFQSANVEKTASFAYTLLDRTTCIMLRVFLSSTGRDLHKCRSLVYQAVEGLDGYHCVRMEDFGAWNEAPADLCRRRVAECDLFVILAGPLYGTIVPGGPSYTEFEYDIAQETQKPCLIFLTSEAFLIPANLVEPVTTKRKQDVFRKKIGSRVQAMFSTCTELPGKVLQAIHNWETTPAEHSVIRIHPISPNGDAREFRRPFLRFGRNPEAEL